MEALTPGHLVIILIAVILMAGYKKLPEASRSIGRSLRIFRSEMRTTDTPAPGGMPAAPPAALTHPPTPEELDAEAAAAERLAADLRARAGTSEPGSPAA